MTAPEGNDDLAWDVRRFVYAVIVERGAPPSVEETAAALGLSVEAAQAAFHRLHELHALFLEPGGVSVRMAHPFSGVPTAFRAQVGDVAYWANCAWDALGIPAALGADAAIAASYAEDGAPAALDVVGGAVRGRGVIHFLLPFRRWYEDLVFT
jgi:hypothetical protein